MTGGVRAFDWRVPGGQRQRLSAAKFRTKVRTFLNLLNSAEKYAAKVR